MGGEGDTEGRANYSGGYDCQLSPGEGALALESAKLVHTGENTCLVKVQHLLILCIGQ